MPVTPPIKPMTTEQQEKLFRIVKIGSDWVQGKINFKEVEIQLGPPNKEWVSNEISRNYYPEGVGIVRFVFDKNRLENGQPIISSFSVRTNSYIEPRIRKELFESHFTLRKRIRGELIDDVRKEDSDFFYPGYRHPNGDPNSASFGYRLPMPTDTLFDVNFTLEYLGKNDPPRYPSLQNAENLRGIQIWRHYLTEEQLQQRRTMAK